MAAADLAAAAGEETDASSAESPDTSRENVRREEGEAAAVGEDKQEAKGKITTVHLRILHYQGYKRAPRKRGMSVNRTFLSKGRANAPDNDKNVILSRQLASVCGACGWT